MNPGALVKMSSTVSRGETEGTVVATGHNTFIGRTASLIQSVEARARFQVVLIRSAWPGEKYWGHKKN